MAHTDPDPTDGARTHARRSLPVLEGILPLDRPRLGTDVVAGIITLAALGIPEVMGYAKIAGMPVVAGSIDDIDYTGWKTLEELRADLADRKVRLVLADASDPVKAELDRYGLTQELGADAFYPSVADVIDARATPAP